MSQRQNTYKKPDFWHKQAKLRGWAARSACKLAQIDSAHRIFAPGMRVLDLGCAPGSWTQYAAEKVGAQGDVLGLDLQPVTVALPAWARCCVQDAQDFAQGFAQDTAADNTVGHITAKQGLWDVVLSDMAPKTCACKRINALRSLDLVQIAENIAQRTLAPKGAFVVKLLEGADANIVFRKIRARFSRLCAYRPQATRGPSTEVFWIARK